MNLYQYIQKEEKQILIVGITGEAEHGKDTVARIFKRIIGEDICDIRSFADPLKQSCMILFGLSENDVYTTEGKCTFNPRINMTPRELLQKVGTDLFRMRLREVLPELPYNESIWVWNMEQHISNTSKALIIPDVRFLNEAEMLERHKAIIINQIATHYILYNEGTLEELETCVEDLWKCINRSSKIEACHEEE